VIQKINVTPYKRRREVNDLIKIVFKISHVCDITKSNEYIGPASNVVKIT
jgi:hypothetical protein